ncbi:hypothetical protein Agabi119p4_8029 [Agaricus bisporus var. burnettii]|uniref:Uncharacterized protein n=1 Tax=Agaricus bisporus var. burnettii TaxID=192524 RepID=A0A8H7C6A2_AGABI|nr:hypothetical protein Agabi119p4_8029 [Agaricus bisporus var. burnettii]
MTCPSGNIHFNGSHTRKTTTTSTCTSDNSRLYYPQPQTQTSARGLTPIIITPESSSRPHTPAAGSSDRGSTPVLRTLTTPGTTRRQAKKIKFEVEVEPVELDPIMPSAKRRKAMAVSMDNEDEGIKVPQLPPTPCMTPVLRPVDSIIVKGEERGVHDEFEFGDKSPRRTGRAILPAFRSRPDVVVPASSYRHARIPSLSDLADVAERERLVYDHEDGKRGRTRERRKSSRFREFKPYMIRSEIPSASSCRLPAMPPSHPLPPPPHNAQQTQPPSSSPALPAISPPHPIPKAADQLIHLFNSELQHQIQAERDSLRFEFENLLRERSEIQRERELMQREREEQRVGRISYEAYVNATNEAKDKEIRGLREENQTLRIRVEELQGNIRREA